MSDLSDERELITLALSGNSDAFGVLVARFQDRLYTTMLNVVGNAEEAEDVVQESFIQAYIKLDTFQMQSQFFTWLYRIAFNNALSRRRRNRNQLSLDQSREATGNEPLDVAGGPETNMVRNDNVRLVQEAMAKLSEDHRAILILREMQDMAYEDIAEILDISIGTVRSRLNRARSHLRELLEKTPDWRQ